VTERPAVLRFDEVSVYDAALHSWMARQSAPLRALAQHWFGVMRACGDEVRETWHDGNANACVGDAPFAYVGVFTAHVSVGFFQGASLPDPHGLLRGTGKRMRHVTLVPGEAVDATALEALILAAYDHLRSTVTEA
jgi:hypothetical protein